MAFDQAALHPVDFHVVKRLRRRDRDRRWPPPADLPADDRQLSRLAHVGAIEALPERHAVSVARAGLVALLLFEEFGEPVLNAPHHVLRRLLLRRWRRRR